jgi:hypothetical protein
MSLRQRISLGLIAALGLVAAAGMGVLANAIAGDSIGLSAKPLRAGDDLAPPAGRSSPERHRQGGAGAGRSQDANRGQAAPNPPPSGAVEPGDDHGGGTVDNSGPGSLNSGSGSSSSGSGSSSSGSGSSGSGSSGSGSSGSGSGSSGSSGGSGDD